MRIPFVPSLPGPAPAVVRRVLGDDADEPESTGADTDVAGQPVPTVASGAGSGVAGPGASTADPRLATPPLRVDRSTDADWNPVLTAADVDDVAHISFVADPFVVRAGSDESDDTRDDGPYHCFFEVKRRDRRSLLGLCDTEARFDIGHATSPDGRDWTYEGVVLPAAQAEHTYPHVFHHDDDWWMVPSPAGSTPDELRVYRAADFPTDWELVETTLAGEVRIDPTPFEYDGTWFLVHQAPDYSVRLRYSDRLVGGEWEEHPASPLFDPGANDVAPGGRPLVDASAGTVDLFFRRGDPGIVEGWRVVDPSRDEWSMHELPTSPVVVGSGELGAWDERNVHHIDAGLARATGSDLVLVDGQDADRRYRLGVARTREFDGDGADTARLSERTVYPGERAVLSTRAPTAAPDAGWYRVSVRPAVESHESVTVEVSLAAGDATASGVFDAAGEAQGHVGLGPVGLEPGARPVVELRHDGSHPVRVTGGVVCLWWWW